jgi:anti-sigma factor RsiW
MSSLGNDHVQDDLLLRVMDNELRPRQAEQVKRHIEQCADCHARLDQFRAVMSRVVEYHREAIVPDAAVAAVERQRFMQRLEQAADEPRRRWGILSGLSAPWRVAWCGALCLLIVAGLTIWTWRSRPAVSKVVSRIATPRPVAEVAPPAKQLVARVASEPAARPLHRTAKKRRPAPKEVVEEPAPQVVASEEIVTPFFALPFSDAALPLDQAGVIRVELPRSALRLAGLPVDENRRNERVHADLIVGVDGLARAIRFVR